MESRPGLWRRLLGLVGVDLRPGEGKTTALLFCSLLGIITFQYVTKTVRQATFVDSLGATRLPYVYLLVALTAYPFLRIYLRLAEGFSRRLLMRGSLLVTALSMVGFWWLFHSGQSWVPMLFYVWVSMTFVALVSQFWVITSHALDSRQARRLFAFIGAGGLLGSVAGGQLARLAALTIGAQAALLLAGLLLVAVALLLGWVPEAGEAQTEPVGGKEPQESPESGGLRLLWASPHLRMIGLVLLLSVLVAQTVDLQFSWAVEQATAGLGERTAWFGNFFSAMGVAAFLFQIFFTSRIHTALGVGVALRVLPVVVILGTLALMGAAGFLPEVVLVAALSLKLGESGLRYSLDQSTRELLFMPVPAAGRLRAKAIIDVFLQRSGKGLAALFLLPIAFGWVAPVQAGWFSLVLCVAWLVAAGQVARTYVRSFRVALDDRTVAADETINLADVRTVELLIQSLGSTDARQVLHSLQILRANERGHLVPPLLLYHDDAQVRLQTLQILAEVDRKDTAPLVERCLADEDPDVRAEAIGALTRFNAADACVLMRPRLRGR